MYFLFDVDDTMYDQREPFYRALHEVFPQIKVDEEALFLRTRYYGDQIFPKQQQKIITVFEAGVYRMLQACKDFQIPITEEQAVLFQRAYQNAQKNINLQEEIVAIFDLLKQHQIPMGVITNGPKEHQRAKVQQLNLERWFLKEHIFISGEVGYDKPDLRLFEYVETKMNLEKESTYYIGDSYAHDIVGAKQAKWHSFWLNHRHRKEIEPLLCDQVFYDYTSLYETIKTMLLHL